MGLFSSWDNFTSGIGNNLPLLAITGLGLYQAYNKRKNADKAARMRAQWEASQRASQEGAAAEEGPAGPDMGMLGQGIDYQKQMLAQAMQYLKPYREASLRMLPIMENAYKSGMGNVGMLSGYLMDPKMLATMNPQTPAYNINVPLPEYLKYGSK